MGDAIARRWASQSVSMAEERYVLLFGFDVVFRMLFDLDVYLLAGEDIHDAERGSALSDAIQDVAVAGVISPV